MRLKRLSKSSYLTQIGWHLWHIFLFVLQMDPFALGTVILLGTYAYIFIPMACKIDGIGMGIMLIIFVAGSCIGGIIKFVGLAYFANNVDDVFGNLNAKFDNLVTGKPNTFVPKGRQGRRTFPCKYAFIPETESDKAYMRKCQVKTTNPSKAEYKKVMDLLSFQENRLNYEPYLSSIAMWAQKGYVQGWYRNEYTIENGEFKHCG